MFSVSKPAIRRPQSILVAACGRRHARRGSRQPKQEEALTIHGLRYVRPHVKESYYHPKDKYVGMRLDEVLANMFDGSGRGSNAGGEARFAHSVEYWQRECEAGRVEVKPHRRHRDEVTSFAAVSANALVGRQSTVRVKEHVHERVTSAVVPSILYESATILAVNKPGGLPTHVIPQTMQDARSSNLPSSNLLPAHRLDIGTTGVLIFAKGNHTLRQLQTAFKERTVRKRYVARVCGRLQGRALQVNGADGEEGWLTISHSLRFDSRERRAVPVEEGKRGGKACRTDIRHLAECSDGTSLVECTLHSGRRHQIRAHLASIGHPIANDAHYGGEPPPVDTPRIYRDDESTGALAQMLEDASVSWCDKCAWCLAAVRGEAEAPFAPSPIWLHSQLCEFPGGPLVAAPLPEWAQAAANVRNWTC